LLWARRFFHAAKERSKKLNVKGIRKYEIPKQEKNWERNLIKIKVI
jgi:hypothetical protein